MAELKAISWEESMNAIRDLALLRKLANRFDPRIVQPDALAHEAFYRISELLDDLARKESARSDAYREGQREMSDYAIYLMQRGERDVPSLVRGLLEKFDLMDNQETTQADPKPHAAGSEAQ